LGNYKHIYFDLDRTLWDFDNNSREALTELYYTFQLENYFPSSDEFIKIYHKHNDRLWAQYREGNLSKETLRFKRFELTFREKNLKNQDIAKSVGEEYLHLSMLKTLVFPNTYEVLGYLNEKYYLYILTNGFRETQLNKLKNCRLSHYFQKVFTSETIGYNKPHREIFHWAVSSVNARKEECLMIGDDMEVDIYGAEQYGIDSVFFNPAGYQHPDNKSTYEINDLIELKKIL